jgi:hypothetical protein
MIVSLIIPLAELSFAHEDVRVMTNETPFDHPTEENIVSCPCEVSLLP